MNDIFKKQEYRLLYLSEFDKTNLETDSNKLTNLAQKSEISLEVLSELKNLIDSLTLKREQFLIRYINVLKQQTH